MNGPTRITALDDPRVAAFADVRDADLRGRDGLFLCESETVVRRALMSSHRVDAVLVSEGCLTSLGDALHDLPGAPVYVADESLMTKISGYPVHHGALATCHRPADADLGLDAALGHLREQSEVVLIAAEGVTHIDNMGGLFRNAAAFGAHGVLLDPTCCDPLFRKAIRVSMGHVLAVPFAVSADWPGDLLRLRDEWGISIVGAESVGEATPVWECETADRMCLLFGSEGHGLSREAMDACDQVCSVPMAEGVPSLNVATASAVFLYELMCRRTVRA